LLKVGLVHIFLLIGTPARGRKTALDTT